MLFSLLFAVGCVKQAPVTDPGVAHPLRYMLALPADAISWNPIDPAQPDGVLLAVASGDPATGPSVLLMSFPGGSQAPLHTHSATYTAIVLAGAPAHGVSAEDNLTLDVGSYWVQPGGEPHFDACTGAERCVLALAFEGPRDFALAEAPSAEAAKMTIVRSAEVAFNPVMPDVPDVPELAVLRGDPATGAFVSMMRFPAGYAAGRHSHDASYTGGVITGDYQHGDDYGMVDLGPGAVWWQDAAAIHDDVCGLEAPCLTFQVVDGPMSFHPADAE